MSKLPILFFAAIATLFADPFLEDQYTFIRPVLEKYRRPFTVLNLGGRIGYTERILDDFPNACVVSFEPFTEAIALPRVALLHKKISLSDLQKLSEVEHFDVVLALGFHPELIPKPKSFTSKIVLSTLSTLGHNLFLELASPDNHYKNYQKALSNNQLIVEQDLPTQTYRLQNNARTRLKDHWFAKEFTTFLFTTWDKSLRTLPPTSPWTVVIGEPQGISLPTFLLLEGIFPSRETLATKIALLPWGENPFLTVWNIKVAGEDLITARPTFTTSPLSKEKALYVIGLHTKEEIEESLIR